MLFYKSLITSFIFIFGVSISNAETLSQKQMLKKLPNFSVSVASQNVELHSDDALDCRAHIEKVVCLVDPPVSQDGELGSVRPCLPGSKEYAKYFETLYDNYPPTLQKMFCSLQFINIEKEFFGTAYAGIVKDKAGNHVGAIMGIRKSVLDENLSLNLWASWKEQLSFGGVVDSYKLTPGLPTIDTSSNGKVNDFLYFVVTHEFGHIFDFANEINKVENCPENATDCEMHEGSWGAISWKTDKTPKPENEFLNRAGLCFYGCNGNPLPASAITGVYRELDRTDFISTYATKQPWDDFADSLAYYLMSKNLNTRYVIDTKDGSQFDIINKLASPLWEKKFKYIEQFLEADIVYP